ncbi:hypothetical protein ACU3L3_14445 [Priestia endophytica]|uniref:Uncharacterized protein n=1 Tax=Priestia endophytica DSM 13796 TaxID=1121089 RepID=A0A1I6C7B7_9BACI|nr:hypothetical protein [Priestia endophytica]KYG33488.1 hypothetical protein AZF06_21840 [Priestia endophytica]SFQ89086.1 hypothetical protein SAMN02745910_05196 [Priestia endophytica DSM 13796]
MLETTIITTIILGLTTLLIIWTMETVEGKVIKRTALLIYIFIFVFMVGNFLVEVARYVITN